VEYWGGWGGGQNDMLRFFCTNKFVFYSYYIFGSYFGGLEIGNPLSFLRIANTQQNSEKYLRSPCLDQIDFFVCY